MRNIHPRKLKSLRALFIAAFAELPRTEEINRGLRELEKILYPEKFSEEHPAKGR